MPKKYKSSILEGSYSNGFEAPTSLIIFLLWLKNYWAIGSIMAWEGQ